MSPPLDASGRTGARPADTPPARTVAVVGGGFSGAVFAIKLARACPRDTVLLVERGRRAGVGLAYGACAPQHLLNVPVSRMELGLSPAFADWLRACGEDLGPALAESGGALADAFVPRALFGRYMEAQVEAARSANPGSGLRLVRGEAVRLLEAPDRGVVLADGREVAADVVVLATGNMAPGRPRVEAGAEGLDTPLFVPDPWAPDAFEELPPGAPLLLVGAGLTMADVALRLAADGRCGPMTAVSRHGWAPRRHAAGGSWAPFLAASRPQTPLAAMRTIRRELDKAQAAGMPWQRVFDAARPDVARVWRGWDEAARARFLRHARSLWDVHRHRMAPRVADALDALVSAGRLHIRSGRLAALHATADGVEVELRGGERLPQTFARIVNCTGPRSDFDRLEAPLHAHMRRRGLATADPLRLGLETEHSAVLGVGGAPSSWLFALGPLARPALWEVTAAPEINAQVDALVSRLAAAEDAEAPPPRGLDAAFFDLGAGI